jgi:hypothetical protein
VTDLHGTVTQRRDRRRHRRLTSFVIGRLDIRSKSSRDSTSNLPSDSFIGHLTCPAVILSALAQSFVSGRLEIGSTSCSNIGSNRRLVAVTCRETIPKSKSFSSTFPTTRPQLRHSASSSNIANNSSSDYLRRLSH